MTILETLRNKWVIVVASLVALLLAGAVVAATTDTSEEASDESREVKAHSRRAEARPDAVALSSDESAEQTAALPAPSSAGRAARTQAADPVIPGQPRVVKTATVRVEVEPKSFLDAFTRASEVATAHGGFVLSSTSTTDDEVGSSGEVVLRVPADRFDAARRDLKRLGDVQEEQLRGEDVSGQLVDLDARIRSLQVQEEAFRTLLTRAKTVGEILEVQQQLTMTRTQIEQLSAQRAQLSDAAALATIHLSLFEPGVQPVREDEGATGLAKSFERAVDGAVAVVGGVVVVLGYLIPLAALGLLGWLGFRVRRRVAAA